MKKNTMYILGGVALVGVAYYLYNKNKPTTQTNSSGFANLSGGNCTACGGGYNYKWVQYIDPYSGKNIIAQTCVSCGTTKSLSTGTPITAEKGTCCGGGSSCPSGYTCMNLSFDGGKTVVCRCVAS